MEIFKTIQKSFIQGIVIIIPAYVTITIVQKIFSLTINFLKDLSPSLAPLKINGIPYSEFMILAILITIIGYFVKKKRHDFVTDIIENKIIAKIPIIKNIYQGTKKILDIFKKSTDRTSQTSNKIAWVKLPKQNLYTLGFFIGKLEEKYTPEHGNQYYSFFIPTTPNPVTGYYIVAAENEFIFNNMTREEAISIIISGGIIRPDTDEQKSKLSD
jgi:uncharacterized membrane protein